MQTKGKYRKIMNIRVEELTDENIRYFVKNRLEFFIDPIKKNQKQYLQYFRQHE